MKHLRREEPTRPNIVLPKWALPWVQGPKDANCLWAPDGFWREISGRDIHYSPHGCNGCGTARSFWVPDTMYRLQVTVCCNIHDYMCARSIDEIERRWTDVEFFFNLTAWIDAKSRFFLIRELRKHRALLYFKAVRAYSEITSL